MYRIRDAHEDYPDLDDRIWTALGVPLSCPQSIKHGYHEDLHFIETVGDVRVQIFDCYNGGSWIARDAENAIEGYEQQFPEPWPSIW